MKSRRAEITLAVLALVALGAVVVGIMAPKPKFLDGRSKDADRSAATSEAVEKAVAAATAAQAQLGATVAASHQEMGVAAGQLADSPQKEFLQRELVWLSPLLPPPDAKALIAARDRRIAVLEGEKELVIKLYAQCNKDRAALLERATKADARADKAIEAKRESDDRAQENAAYARGAENQRNVFIAVAVLAVGLYLYRRFTGIGFADIARMANRARAGMPALEAIDATVPDWMHARINAVAAKLSAKDAAKKAAAEATAATL
jgi:hypothetical protein